MERRKFLMMTAGLAFSLICPQPARAKKGICKPKKGYKLIIDQKLIEGNPKPTDLMGREAPKFYQRDINPRSSTFRRYIGPQDFRGRIVAINYWSTYCPPCIAELPLFDQYHRKGDLVVLACETADSDATRGTNMMGEKNVDIAQFCFPVLGTKGKVPFSFRECEPDNHNPEYWDRPQGSVYDYMGAILADNVYGSSGVVPSTFIADKNQIVREVIVGAIGNVQLERVIAKYR